MAYGMSVYDNPTPMPDSPLQIQDIKAHYANSDLRSYFGPDYGRTAPVLIKFKQTFPLLEDHQVLELKRILAMRPVGADHIIAADLLYMYRPIPAVLFEPMMDCAIDYEDPSFNRVFLRPCMKAFGDKAVADMLLKKFRQGDTTRKDGIVRLLYWFRYKNEDDVQDLYKAVRRNKEIIWLKNRLRTMLQKIQKGWR